ncbi:MAG: RNA-guided endonuclease TnpB family protein [Deinococcales bacterium]
MEGKACQVEYSNKTIRIKLQPNKTQEKQFLYQASLCRYVYNWGLARRKEVYEQTGKGLSYNQQSGELTSLKTVNDWLYGTYADCLQQSLKDLDRAFKNFFEKRANFPKFKSKHKVSPVLRYAKDCRLERRYIKLPKIGWVKCRNTHEFGKIKSVTVKRDKTGCWYATCVTPIPIIPPVKPKSAVGVDLGLKSFTTITDGITYQHQEAPQFFRKLEKELAKAQKGLARKQKDSNRRAKAKLKVAKLHKRIRNLRSDFLHQASRKLVNDFDLICIEDLNIKGLGRTRLAKSISDAGLGEFVRQLEYKSNWYGKNIEKVDRFFPSSKLCRACGCINDKLSLSDRVWTCGCGATHDRDKNAALNILFEGLRLFRIDSSEVNQSLSLGKTNGMLAQSVEARIPFI